MILTLDVWITIDIVSSASKAYVAMNNTTICIPRRLFSSWISRIYIKCSPIALWNVGTFTHIRDEHFRLFSFVSVKSTAITHVRNYQSEHSTKFVASMHTLFSEMWYLFDTSTYRDIIITLINNFRDMYATVFEDAYRDFLPLCQLFLSTSTSATANRTRSLQQS